MSNPGPPQAPNQPPGNGYSDPLAARPRRPAVRWWLHILLLVLTFITTSVMGAAFVRSFNQGAPVDLVAALDGYAELLRNPALLLTGLSFSVPLIAILLTHELGHYITCMRYGVDASLPYFIPFPAPIGTFGAFIRIRAPIYSRGALFDIASNGPIAGFVVLVPVLAIGIWLSRVIPGAAERGDFVFGVPLIMRLFEDAFFPGVPASDIYLHPVARAAWVGVLATALNLLPIGQLDGGHILYSFAGDRARIISRVLVVALIPLGLFFWTSWLIWAVFLFFFAMRHPPIFDPRPLDKRRLALAAVCAIILILCFTVEPIRR